MHEEVSGDSGAIILPLAPLKEVLGIPPDLRRGAKEARPVAGLFGGIERDGVIPCADGRIAVPIGTDHVELADDSGSQQLFCFRVDDRADTLASYLNDALGLARRFDDLRAIGVDVDRR